MIGWLAVWSNHFKSSFHFDDFPTIVDNQSIQHLSNIPRFFTTPRLSSAEKDSAAYRPLLSASFALDYWLGGPEPFVFQLENWLWFTALLVVMFLLFRVIPGVNNFAAAFGTLLFGLHPVAADTVNYALQRGVMMGTFGVTGGMLIFVCWPWRLPQKLPVKLKRVPQHGLDEYLRNNFQRLDALYLKIIHAPAGLYLWPVIPALLACPATAVFAPILLVYILLLETNRTALHAIPASVVCVGYWIFQRAFIWNLGELSRTPVANYWFTQPWVAMRYLAKFFVPVDLSVDSGFGAFPHFWDPLAIAGYAGTAALVVLAVLTARSRTWRAFSFGIWWFLLALLPDAIVPQRPVEADWRMFLPFAGLALSVAAVASIAFERVKSAEKSRRRIRLSIAGALAATILGVFGWATFQRSAVWESEAALWSNTITASPANGRAFMRYGLTRLAAGDSPEGFDYLRRAATLTPHDSAIEVHLALGYEQLGQSAEAEGQFRQAMADAPTWSPAYSSYGRWLHGRTRLPEAFAMASKALALDPYDLAARRTLMDVMADEYDWAKLKQFAYQTLHLLPDDPDAQRSLEVAQTGLEQVAQAEAAARTEPGIDNYLAVSVQYFRARRYEDSIKAAREALRINPNQAEAYANIASAYHALGNLDETITALEEEVRLNPDLQSAKSNLKAQLTEKASALSASALRPALAQSTSAQNKR